MNYALLQDGLRYWGRQSPDRLALVLDDSASVTYAQLDRWSDGLAEELERRGVRIGDNVGITGANCLEWLPAAFGILKAGGVIVPFNDRFVQDELDQLIAATEPRLIVADRPRLAMIGSLSRRPPLIPMEGLGDFRSGPVAQRNEVRVSSDSTAMIIFTSGTTGLPKGVMLGHATQLAKFYEFVFAEPSLLSSDLRVLMPFGLYGGPGLAWGAMITTVYGGTMYITTKFDPASALATIVGQRINYILGMPLIYERVGRLKEFETADLSFLKVASVGGARVSKEMTRLWNSKGIAVRQLYGMTEVGGNGIIATHSEALAQPDACGRGMMFTRVRVVDDEGKDCQPNTAGHVLIRGPGMMQGYWRNPEATAELLTADGWIRTGDIGLLDEQGYFFYVDRAKDIVISGGFNISPSEVERVVLQIDGVLEACVFPVVDEKFGEVPAVCVHTSRAVTPKEVFAHCRERLAGYKLPRYVIVSPEPLPRMASSKINRRGLAASNSDAPTRFERLG